MAGYKIIFIHGIGAKPPKEEHLLEWRMALNSMLPAKTFAMAYWPDLRGEELSIPTKGEAKDMVREVLTDEQQDTLSHTDSYRTRFLPWYKRWFSTLRAGAISVSEPIVRFMLDQYVDDVYNYFYRGKRREEILERVYSEWRKARQQKQDVIFVTHSMGTVIGLDAVAGKLGWDVKLFITMGSPLGLDWIKDALDVPVYPYNVGHWVNVFDRIDPVTRPDQRIANDYLFDGKEKVEDNQCRDNYREDGQRYPHSWYGYLTSIEVQGAVDRALGLTKTR